jgi:hyperosmotically inducible periplasmic protein
MQVGTIQVSKGLVLFGILFLVVASGLAKEQHAPSTAQIVAEVQDKLYHAKVFKHGDVQVSYQDGVVTLTGTVDSVGVKNDAEKAARRVDEVTSVVNNITVHAEDVTPRQIAEQARKEIITYPFYTIFDNIALRVDGDTLIVEGQVTEPYKKSDIGNFLSHIKGVATIQNDLEVLPVSNYDDQLRIAIARAIYGDPFFVNYANQAIPPIHIVVKNGNVTLEGVVDSEIAKAKAETDARFAATFFSLTNNLRVEGPSQQ